MSKEDWVEKFGKIMERMETRKKNTEKAKEDLATIMEALTDLFPDATSGYKSENSFFVKSSWWDGQKWVHYNGKCRFMIKDGKVWAVSSEYSNKIFCSKDINDEVDYINFEQMVTALIEFIDSLLNVETWDKEVEVIGKIKDSLPQVED